MKSLDELFPSLGFLGAGNMAGAIIRAVIAKGLPPASVAAIDIDAEKTAALKKELGIRVPADAKELFRSCKAVVLATKPQDLFAALDSVKQVVTPDHLIISIAAGTRAAKIESHLPPGTRVVRVMPNTPAMIGEGAAGVAGGSHATEADVESVVALFQAVGIAARVDEDQLDAVTALSGSGPAYVFRFLELMQAAGIEMGLDAQLAKELALQTFLGATKLAIASDETLETLRQRVTSKGGTTAAALAVMEERGLEAIIKEALKRARDRSIELSR